MSAMPAFRLGLIVHSTAYAQRSARTQLDVALLAATLDFNLHIYFMGNAVLQLIKRGDTAAALLPAGYRAWASLPGLLEQAELKVFADVACLERLRRNGQETCLPVHACSAFEMRQQMVHCDRLLTL